MKRALGLIVVVVLAVHAAGCWCPCEAHGTTLPLPQQKCTDQNKQPSSEPGPSSQPSR